MMIVKKMEEVPITWIFAWRRLKKMGKEASGVSAKKQRGNWKGGEKDKVLKRGRGKNSQ